VQIKDIAYARSGDKGDVVNVGVLALDDAAYEKLQAALTPERLKAHFGDWVRGEIHVFPMPNINGFNLLLHNALGGGQPGRFGTTSRASRSAPHFSAWRCRIER